jgi:hypothetical protein
VPPAVSLSSFTRGSGSGSAAGVGSGNSNNSGVSGSSDRVPSLEQENQRLQHLVHRQAVAMKTMEEERERSELVMNRLTGILPLPFT